jgi:hypothetical protein
VSKSKISTLLFFLILITLLSCVADEHDSELFEILSILNLEHNSLKSVKKQLITDGVEAIGDTLAVALNQIEPENAPAQGRSRAIELADEILSGFVSLPKHSPKAIPENPSWTEGSDGDPNWEFQYHTFRWVMPLLYAWEETKDIRYLDRFIFLLQDYGEDVIEADPSLVSWLAWNDMGSALRVENWLETRRILLKKNALPYSLHVKMLKWFNIHGKMLSEDIKYKHENNHGTFHSRALLSLAVSAPELANSNKWFDLAVDRLQRQVLDLVGIDGSYNENAPQYHFMAINNFSSVRNLLFVIDRDFSEETATRLDLLNKTCAHFIKPDGSLPMFGDSPARMNLSGYKRRSPELKYSITQGKSGKIPVSRMFATQNGGYVISRSGWGSKRPFSDESWALLDVGLKGGGHGHADALNVLFYAQGADLLVDSGMYTFASGQDRNDIISSKAHNLLFPESVPKKWKGYLESDLLYAHDSESYSIAAASTDSPPGGVWTRFLIRIDPDDLLVIDTITKHNDKKWAQYFRLHPDASWGPQSEFVTVNNKKAVMDVWAPGSEITVHDPDSSGGGWYSAKYGQRVRNAVIEIDHEINTSVMPVFFHTHKGNNPLKSLSIEIATPELFQAILSYRTNQERIKINLVNGQFQKQIIQ